MGQVLCTVRHIVNSHFRRWLAILGALLMLFSGHLAAQTIRSNASQFPSVHTESDGSSSVPAISFVQEPTNGFFRPSSGVMGFTAHLVPGADGTLDLGSPMRQIRNIYVSGAISGASFTFGNGSAGSPSITFTNALTKGFYLEDANTIGVSGFLGAGSDASYDIGLAASKRFRNAFLSGIVAGNKVQVGAGAATTANITMTNGATGQLDLKLGDESDWADPKARKYTSTGGVLVATTITQPACSVTYRGLFWVVQGAAGIPDQVQVCAKSGDDAYYWVTMF